MVYIDNNFLVTRNSFYFGNRLVLKKKRGVMILLKRAENCWRRHYSKEIIVEKIKDVQVSSGVQSVPKLEFSILCKGVVKLLNIHTARKMPKAFKPIPSLGRWDEVLLETEPEKWSPNAMYQATRIFASMGVKKADDFYKLILLPRIRVDIKKDKKLLPELYKSLKKALYKPAAFYKGIIFPLCESRTCTVREAIIVGSIIEKISIPAKYSSAALSKLAMMDYNGPTSWGFNTYNDYFCLYVLQLFYYVTHEKKYALPYRAYKQQFALVNLVCIQIYILFYF
ncbi:hypothetical protein ACJIZ3_018653 [Penstemon smallii]|uniref:Uncharacterized protein n=1 Tax=Penstemon smallii TaxID=265156 RepID=A0ABD3SYX6_9LAMI